MLTLLSVGAATSHPVADDSMLTIPLPQKTLFAFPHSERNIIPLIGVSGSNSGNRLGFIESHAPTGKLCDRLPPVRSGVVLLG